MTAPILTAEQIGLPICEALGLDAKMVRSLTLTLKAGQMPTLLVETYVRDSTETKINQIKTVFAEYELRPRAQPKEDAP